MTWGYLPLAGERQRGNQQMLMTTPSYRAPSTTVTA
jgi:hypothetical protein